MFAREGTATQSRIPAWRIPWTEEPGGLQSMVSQRVMTERLTLSLCFPLDINSDVNEGTSLKTLHFQRRGLGLIPGPVVWELRSHMLCAVLPIILIFLDN